MLLESGDTEVESITIIKNNQGEFLMLLEPIFQANMI
jgi:hypothetical protein